MNEKITHPSAIKSSRLLPSIRDTPMTSTMPVARSPVPNSANSLMRCTATATSVLTPITSLCCQNRHLKTQSFRFGSLTKSPFKITLIKVRADFELRMQMSTQFLIKEYLIAN